MTDFKKGDRVRVLRVYSYSDLGKVAIDMHDGADVGTYMDVWPDNKDVRHVVRMDSDGHEWFVWDIEPLFKVGDRVRITVAYPPTVERFLGEEDHTGKTGTLTAIDNRAKWPYEIELDNGYGLDVAFQVEHITEDSEREESNMNETTTHEVEILTAEVGTLTALNNTQRDRIHALLAENGALTSRAENAERAATRAEEAYGRVTTENNRVRQQLDNLRTDIVNTLRDLIESDEMSAERAFELADDLGVADQFYVGKDIEIRLTVPSDAVADYLRANGKQADDLAEADIENILNENSSQIEFWIDRIDVQD